MTTTYRTRYFGGAKYKPGTNVPSNVTGECGHDHRTPEAARKCIDATDKAVKAGHGGNAYCDRVVMVQEFHNTDGKRYVVSGSTVPWVNADGRDY